MMTQSARRMTWVVSLIGIMLLFAGCTSETRESSISTASINPDTGLHIAGWFNSDAHGITAKTQSNGFSSCQECHGSDYSGGITSMSCFTCHGVNAPHTRAPWTGGARSHTNTNPDNAPVCALCHSGKSPTPAPQGTPPGCFNNTLCHATPGHAAGWSNPDVHGSSAKSLTNGFATCKSCHGPGFTGGSVQTSCFTCHGVSAPHSPAPWIGAVRTHTTTDAGNASACASCHTNGTNSSRQPSQPAPAGTAPGCFNNTLCHGPAGHAAGWNAPDQHGASVKSQPDGLVSCQECHGAGFTGGTSGTSCFTCHGVSAPHSPAPWIGVVRTHTTTDAGNASACASCHANGANSSRQPSQPAPAGTAPGCFNNTLCHSAAIHAVGWSAPSQHGVTAEQDFAACKACHGATYQGGTAGVACYQCHNGPGLDHPAPGWVVLDHKTAALANSTACTTCHGTDYLGGGSHVACNSCHMENQTKVHLTSWYPDVYLNHRAYAAANGTASCSTAYCHGTDLTGVALSGPSCSTCHSWPFSAPACGSCHAIPPAGAAFPDTAGRHSTHVAINGIVCATCHAGAGPGTALHPNGVADVFTDAVYNAKSGAATFNASAKTCSSVSCHGGKTTPAWSTGTIDVNTQCTSCHASGTAQYNSYNSGRHSVSNHVSRGCTSCHDTTKLAVNHFTALNTTAMEGPASATILNSVNYNGTSCSPSCHDTKNW